MQLFFNGDIENKVKVDPRTKIIILIMISTFVFAGAGGDKEIMHIIRPTLVAIPLTLLLLNKNFKIVFFYGVMYVVFYMLQIYILKSINGLANFILLFSIGVFVRIMPGILSAYYLVTTTTISELVAAMQKVKLSEKIIIPLSVMFRFFPTVVNESKSVNDAMRMRGVYFGGKKTTKIMEYRLIPMITCSVKAGEELSASALCRGLGSPVKRTNICNIGFGVLDYLIIALCILLIIVCVLL